MTTPDDRRPGRAPAQPSQGPGERQARPRRQPLFPLEDDDIASRARRGPPSPLGDLLSDIDAQLPCKAAPTPPGSPRSDAPAPETGQRPRPQGDERRRPESATRPGSPPAQPPRRQAAPEPDRAPAQPPRRQAAPVAGPPPAPAPRREAASEPDRPPAPQRIATKEPPAPQRVVLRPSVVSELVEAQAAPLRAARERLDATMADLSRLEHEAAARGQLDIGGYFPPGLPAMSMSRWAWMGVIILASVLVIGTLRGDDGALSLSKWGAALGIDSGASERRTLFAGQARPAGDYVLRAPPSISAAQIDGILSSYGSPAAGTGEIWYNLGLQYGIDPAFAIAFFIHESAAGTAQAWAGLKTDGGTTHNVGNIICAGYATCYGRFRDYPSWSEGIEDWYRLIDVEYLQGRGHQTVADIIPVYAPSVENDVQGYINVVQAMVDEWRTRGTP